MTQEPDLKTPASAPSSAGVRKRLDLPEPPDPQRSGCLWLGGILGVIAGVLFTFLLLPHILDWAFQPEQVAAGQTFAHEGRVITVRGLAPGPTTPSDAAGTQRWLVTVELTANRSWTIGFDTFKLRLESGDELKTAAFDEPGLPQDAKGNLQLPLGAKTTVTLHFVASDDSPPEKLLLHEPQAEFALPPAAQR